jgi:hypothetical protein
METLHAMFQNFILFGIPVGLGVVVCLKLFARAESVALFARRRGGKGDEG